MRLSDSLYLGLIVIGLFLSVAGFGIIYASVSESPVTAQTVMQSEPVYRFTADGVKYTVSPDSTYTLCPGECIPSLNSPQYTSRSAADNWLNKADLVLGVQIENETYAFPLRIMRHHHIVNTELAGKPVAVTYSPHSAVPRVYRRTVNGKTMVFSVSGALYNGNMLMRDTLTGSVWSQLLGRAVIGNQVPAQLDSYPAHIVPWEHWKATHPNTTVLSRNTSLYKPSRYEDNPYVGYISSDRTPTAEPFDTQFLAPKDIVYGVTANNQKKAYRSVHVKDMGLIQDTVGGVPIMLVQNEQTGTIRGFIRRVNGTPTTFNLDHGKLVDPATGSTWNLDGDPIEGRRATQQLQEIDLTRIYWFSWKLFYPQTRLHNPG